MLSSGTEVWPVSLVSNRKEKTGHRIKNGLEAGSGLPEMSSVVLIKKKSFRKSKTNLKNKQNCLRPSYVLVVSSADRGVWCTFFR